MIKRLIFICVLITNVSYSQSNIGIEAKFYYGSLLVHHYYMQHLAEQHFPMVEVGFMKQTTGKKMWECNRHLPVFGVKYIYGTLSSPRYLGSGQAILPYMSVSYIKRKKITVNCQYGWGLGYIQKPFERTTNYRNIAIGSHINAVANIANEIEYRVSDKTRLNLGVSLFHFSNGSFKVPNLGINLVCVTVGGKFFIKNPVYVKKDSTENIETKNEFSISGAMAMKEIYPIGGSKYTVGIVSLGYWRNYSCKGKYGVSLDLFYDEGIKGYVMRDTIETNNSTSLFQMGLIGGYEFRIGKIGLPYMIGIYLVDAYKGNGLFYNRIGGRYYINEHLIANITLKTHFAKADFFEYGLAYRF